MTKRWLEPVPPNDEDENQGFKSLGWFIGISLISGAVVVGTAYLLRGFLFI